MLALVGCEQRSAGAPPTESSVPESSAPESSAPESSSPGVQPVGFERIEIGVVDGDGELHELRVWLADTSERRGRGLMGVTDLGDADGMLFVFEEEAVHRFYMWNTPMPLSIAFFDADGDLVSSAAMTPCLDSPAAQCDRYAPADPFLSAIEVPLGDLADLGIATGAELAPLPTTTEPSGTTDA